MSAGAVLVTGGAGYVGSHFVARLRDDGRRYIVLDDLSRGCAAFVPVGNLVQGDIADETLVVELCREFGVGVVVHFAAYAYVGESVTQPQRYYENNVAKTIRLLAALRRAGVMQFVFSSSCATYGEAPPGESITESAPQRPVNPYGRSKLIVEQVLTDYASAYGLRSIALRYFNAAGASEAHALYEQHDPETHLLPLAIDAALGSSTLEIFGADYPTRDGTCVRDYIHVDDLADAHVRAVDRLRSGGDSLRANLGIGHGASVIEVIDAVSAATQRKVRRRVVGRRPGDPPMLVADARLARRELGWFPRYERLDEIVRTAVEGYRRKERATSDHPNQKDSLEGASRSVASS
jgi:UDP-glucose-4-epimerase GalE